MGLATPQIDAQSRTRSDCHSGERRQSSYAPAPAHPLLTLQQQAGNQAVQSLLRAGLVHAKLSISNPGDPDEREADQVAERVMRMPAPSIPSVATAPVLSRKCASCEEEEKKLARKGTREPATEAAASAPAIVHEVLGSSGHPLDTATRAFFEPRFGHDFSHVRVHTDERAGQSAQAVQASAYTVGQNIVFAPAQYSPGTQKGMELLAHELTHTRQQGNAGPTSVRAVQTLPMEDKGSNVEHQADGTSSSMVETERPAMAGRNTNAQGAGLLPLISRSVAPGTVQRSVPTGITLKETHPVGHANLRTEEDKKKFLTYIADVSLMQLTPPGDYTAERQRGECTKEFLTEVSNTCPAAPSPFCTGDRCFQVNQYQSPVGDRNTGTMVADGPDTFVDYHRAPYEKSLLEGSAKNQCSVVCHQMYKYRTEPDKKYHDLGAFYIIRNFRADKFTPAGATAPINITTGEIRKVPAGSSVPSRDDFAKNIAPGLAQSGALLDAPRITRVQRQSSSVNAARGGDPAPAQAETHPLTHQQQAGNQAVQSLLRSGLIQAKLAISNPGDPDEREADQVADRIMRMHSGAPTSSPCSCSSGEDTCEECQQKQQGVVARSVSNVVQRQATDPQTAPQTNLPASPQTNSQAGSNPKPSLPWDPSAISAGIQQTESPNCYGESSGFSGLPISQATPKGTAVKEPFSRECAPPCARRPLPLRVMFHTDGLGVPRPGVKAGDKVSSVSATVKFTPASDGSDRIVLQGRGDGVYVSDGYPLKTTFDTSLSSYTPVGPGELTVSLINSDRAGQGLATYSDKITVIDCPLPATRSIVGYLEVPDPDNAPLQYTVVDKNTPVPGRGVLVPAEKDDKGYFYLYKGRRVDLPGDPILHGPQAPVQNPGAQSSSSQSSSIQREAADNSPDDESSNHADAALSMLHRDGGQPLDPQSRAFFEPRFGHDLSSVRLHTGGQAAESARSIQALAYTAGNHVVFGAQRYQPSTEQGRRLLAHELAHVVQQGERSATGASLQRKCGKDASGPPPLGCEIVKFSASGQITGVRIRFKQGCDEFADREQGRLESLLDPNKITARTNITVRGMASAEGEEEFNKSLSCNRAAAAVAVLNQKGFGPNVKSVVATGGIPGTADDPDFRAVEINITDSPVPSQGPTFSIFGLPKATAVPNPSNASLIDTLQVHQAMGDFDLMATVAMQAAKASDFDDWQIGVVQTLASPIHQRCFRFPPGVTPPPGYPHPNDVYVATQGGSGLLVPDRDDSDPIFMSNKFLTDLDSVHQGRTSFSFPVTASDTPQLGGWNGLWNYTHDPQDGKSLVFREHKSFVAFTHVIARQRSSGRIIPLYTVQWSTLWDIEYAPSAGTGIAPAEHVLNRQFAKMSEHVFSPGDTPPIVGGKPIRSYAFPGNYQALCP